MNDSPVTNDDAEFAPMPLPGKVVVSGEARQLDTVPFQFSDVRTLAARILKRAQQQAEEKLAAARKQIAQMEKDAHDKGYREGLPKGEKAGFTTGETAGREAARVELAKDMEKARSDFQARMQPVVAVLEQMAAVLGEQRRQLVAQAENDLLLLALDLTKRLVAHELTVDPEAIKPLAVEAIGLVTGRSNLVVRLNPADLATMEEELPSLRLLFPDLGAIKLEGDTTVERGGLMISTREGDVDMRLATRLAAFEDAILGHSGELAVAPWSGIEPGRDPTQPPSFPEPEPPDSIPETIVGDKPSVEEQGGTDTPSSATPDNLALAEGYPESPPDDVAPPAPPDEGDVIGGSVETPPESDRDVDDPANNSLRL